MNTPDRNNPMQWKPARADELDYWWNKAIYHAMSSVDNSDAWNRRKAQLEAYFELYENGNNPYTEEQRRRKKDLDNKLKDTFGAGNWHQEHAKMWLALIEGEKAMRAMKGRNPDGSRTYSIAYDPDAR